METPVEQTWRLRRNDFVDIGQPILDLMLTRGWCPYDLKRLSIQIPEVSVLYYYSSLGAPRSSKDHGRCSEDQCFWMVTNILTYELSHRHANCLCPLLFADREEVARILMNGSIPLIAVARNRISNAPELTIHDSSEADGFVAISHVWAEGAGNVNGNALQSCLVADISVLVKNLPGETERETSLFWIDTLCVPVRPRELQTMALNRMRDPYERAEHVLVLDSHLRSLDSTKLTTTELFAQVSCSSWMRRLWTLQEGRLAKRVWFQFADQAVDVKSAFERLDRTRVPSRVEYWIQASLYVQLWVQIWNRANNITSTGAAAGLIASNRLALSSRSVSVPTDEGLCLFTLMNMDMTQITAVQPTRRMEVVWRTFNKVPISFLFSKAPNKMHQQGLHWAPSSFLGLQSEKEWSGPQELQTPRDDEPHANATPSGLRVALPGFKFHSDLVRRMRDFDFTWNVSLNFQDQDGMWYTMRVEEPWRQGSDITGTLDQLAVVLARPIRDESLGSKLFRQRSEIFSFQDFSVGVLVSLIKTDDNVEYVKAHNHVAVELLGEGYQKYLSTASAFAQEVNVQHSILRNESHNKLKELYTMGAKRLLDDVQTLDLLAAQAHNYGMDDSYESLLDDFLDITVVTARFGDRCRAVKMADDQQWCVD
ncbi:MAG: hypothetical protein Q9181_008201 [Wetmoreana brouardii]